MPKPPEYRKDRVGPIKLMAEVDGYVMVRRPGCTPFVLSLRSWNEMEIVEPPRKKSQKALEGRDA